jgi:beta-1,4-mannooligosaccharide/beta-1,4-mannosyl-N-acetylglucosamine phosphorylase
MTQLAGLPRLNEAGGSPSRGPLARHPRNPILSPDEMPFPCYTVFNCGAVRFGDQVLLMLRAEGYDRTSGFYRATSSDGLNFDVDPEPVRFPLRQVEQHVAGRQWHTHFDMRITPFEGEFLVTHAVWLPGLGSTIAMARTRDFQSFSALPFLSPPPNRNAAIFPEKIGGLYCRLERPQDIDGTGTIWVSYSPDLEFWGRHSVVHVPKTNWNGKKCGAGAVPIRTDAGWLVIYHTTVLTASTENYYLGAMLLDLDDPSKTVAAPRQMILAPEMDYECIGQTPNVVFTCGAVEMDDGTLNIYYGGADTRVCLATTTVDELVEFCLKDG